MRAHSLTSVSDLPSFSQKPNNFGTVPGAASRNLLSPRAAFVLSNQVPMDGSVSSFWNQIRSLMLFLGYSLRSYIVVPGLQGSPWRFDFAGSPYLTRPAK
jgi:hypothetical protein